jgi:putative hydrolase of the HAD superfamily
MKEIKITSLFLDIGGVLLTNGWGQTARNKTVAHFKLNSEEINERHHLTFDTYEEGKLTLTDYLKRVIFYEKRKFSEKDFTSFMFSQSLPYPDTIAFFKEIKKRHQLKVVAVSNEGRELNAYRVKKFKLNDLFDAFVSSSYVHLRKPDVDIFLMAGDISQTPPENSLFIDDRLMFVKVAQTMGINGIHYEGLDKIKTQLKKFGLSAE